MKLFTFYTWLLFPLKFIKRSSLLLKEQFGLDFKKCFFAIFYSYRYLYGYYKYRLNYKGRMSFNPCLSDHISNAGDVASEYFINDLFVAQKIFHNKPQKHIDIGSRLDGFVAHVASFREIEVFDIRPLLCRSKNIIFKRVDMMKPLNKKYLDYADSISCIHALEHFGLGRYGDSICTEGFANGLLNIIDMLKNNGLLYLSVPVGLERVEFNSHRILDPIKVVDFCRIHKLTLQKFYIVEDGTVHKRKNSIKALKLVSTKRYALGTFMFKKQSKS